MSRLWPLCSLTSISRHSPPLSHALTPDLNRHSNTAQHPSIIPFTTPQPISQRESSQLLQSNNSPTSPYRTPDDETAGTSGSSHKSSYHTASLLQGEFPCVENDMTEEVDFLSALPPPLKQQHSRSTAPLPTRKSPLPLRTQSYTRLHPSLLAALQFFSTDASTQTDDADLSGEDTQHAVRRAVKTATELAKSTSKEIPVIAPHDIRSTCSDSLYHFPTPIRRRRGYASLRLTIPNRSNCSSRISLASDDVFRSR